MDLKKILKPELIFDHLDLKSSEEVISFLAGELERRGLVKEEFRTAVLEREKVFPTALQTGSINVAIPHTDVKYVNEPALAVATLQEPIPWRRMDKPDDLIPVQIVFMLAIVDPSEYVKFLSKLTSMFGNEKNLAKLIVARSSEGIEQFLLSSLGSQDEIEREV